MHTALGVEPAACFVSCLQDEQRELAKTIRVSGSILLSTVSNFLDFFKMEAGKALDIVRTEVDVQVCFWQITVPNCLADLFPATVSRQTLHLLWFTVSCCIKFTTQ